ncbi:hypothetical protein F4808DRAFT_461112 [Astrocystis sublimbata]|nr:hypothetical protein F4808DRAFT_461112 [Astrocystis sublimbata]
MYSLKSLLALAAYLGASTVLASPVESESSINPVVDGVNPFSGVSFTPFSEIGCKGKNQGNTNINEGTTHCVNVGNAKSSRITTDECRSAYFETYSELNCKGSMVSSYNHGEGCFDKTGSHASARVYPRDCQ